ncbi:MAG: hypothetical protein H6P95_2418, partial [Candidatus Aminicenantes bacterium]|nr:hypothetical protein [Candidatus Aminicenantes bacterium]
MKPLKTLHPMTGSAAALTLAAALIAAAAGVLPASAQTPPAKAGVAETPTLEVVPTALLVRDGASVSERIVHLVVDAPADARSEAVVKAWIAGKPVVPGPGAWALGPGKITLE